MFDFSGSEIMVIGVVALVLIGPKDLPVAVRAITRVVKKMRRMAGEFQGHVDDMMREADLGDVQSTLRDIRGMGLKGTFNRVVDGDGTLARAFDDPFAAHKVPPVAGVGMPGLAGTGMPVMHSLAEPAAGPAPAFIPPAAVPAAPVAGAAPPGADAARLAAPAFVPPAETHDAIPGDL